LDWLPTLKLTLQRELSTEFILQQIHVADLTLREISRSLRSLPFFCQFSRHFAPVTQFPKQLTAKFEDVSMLFIIILSYYTIF